MLGTNYDKKSKRVGSKIPLRQRWIALAAFLLAFAFTVAIGTFLKSHR